MPGNQNVIVGEDAADMDQPAGQEAHRQRQGREHVIMDRERRGDDDRCRRGGQVCPG